MSSELRAISNSAFEVGAFLPFHNESSVRSCLPVAHSSLLIAKCKLLNEITARISQIVGTPASWHNSWALADKTPEECLRRRFRPTWIIWQQFLSPPVTVDSTS